MTKLLSFHHKFFPCLLILLAISSILPANIKGLALTPENILVVYNLNMTESRRVAEHYIKKRKVPPANIKGLDLPTTETISRQEFTTKLAGVLYEPINCFKNEGRNPVILLVYGVPLRITGYHPARQVQKRQRLIQGKLEELGKLVAGITEELEKLLAVFEQTSSEHPQIKTATPDAPAIFKKARDVLNRFVELRSKKEPGSIPPEITWAMGRAVFRLVGISSLAQRQQRQADRAALINQQLEQVKFSGITDENIHDVASLVRTVQGLLGELGYWYNLKNDNPADRISASVDSELTLLLKPHRKSRWLPNPFLRRFDKLPGINRIRSRTIMVARLDGPTPEIAMRLVDDAIWAENNGLKGIFYIDARGLKGKDAYSQYDRRLRQLYEIVSNYSNMKVVLDNYPELFPEKSAPDAALYVGWYSLAKYVDSFTWQRGAVGFHVASAEATTLKKPGSQVWCKRMLEEGVAATLGPVAEPYLESFPRPEVFFPLLMTGEMPLVKVYYRSTQWLSWQQILIGDPLYNPFMKYPAINLNELD